MAKSLGLQALATILVRLKEEYPDARYELEWETPLQLLVASVAIVSLVCLAVLGGLGARAGGAPLGPSILRVTFWGVLAMLVTAGVGRLLGAAVG